MLQKKGKVVMIVAEGYYQLNNEQLDILKKRGCECIVFEKNGEHLVPLQFMNVVETLLGLNTNSVGECTVKEPSLFPPLEINCRKGSLRGKK